MRGARFWLVPTLLRGNSYPVRCVEAQFALPRGAWEQGDPHASFLNTHDKVFQDR